MLNASHSYLQKILPDIPRELNFTHIHELVDMQASHDMVRFLFKMFLIQPEDEAEVVSVPVDSFPKQPAGIDMNLFFTHSMTSSSSG